ncbi:MAG: sensor histidine kinase, partial [Pseudonocardia sp.]|nr:sensor histidine kinase [Pseudonocardia sp.]
AGAGRIDVRIAMNGALELSVRDDGSRPAVWVPGVGLTSIGERAAELGGTWRAGPGEGGGGLVWARLPVGEHGG